MKTFHKLTIAAIICFAAVSCKDPVPDIDPRDPVIFQNASATYYGATEDHEAYFTMDLTDEGKKLHLEFYGDPVGDYDAPTLKTGNYSLAAGSATEPGTYIAGSGEDGCVYSEANGANADIYDIVDGVFSISLSGTTYNVTVSLKDQDGDDLQGSYTGPITAEDTRDIASDFIWGFTSFYGKKFADDAHLFFVGLDSDGIEWNSGAGEYKGNGGYVRLCLMTGADMYTEIPDGTYTVAEPATPGNIVINDSDTYYAEVVNDVTTKKPLTSGTVTFQKAGNTYYTVLDVSDADGNNYQKFYRGELEYANYSNGFMEDVDLGVFASGQMINYGETYYKTSYHFTVLLLGDGVGVDSEGYITGSGYTMVMEMYSDLDSATGILPMTYSVAATFDPGTLFGGFEFFGADVGSYIYEFEDGNVIDLAYYIVDGTVTVSGTNPNYNIQTAFKCPNGFNIASSYSGELVFFDKRSKNILLPKPGSDNRRQFSSPNIANHGDYYGTGVSNLKLTARGN